MGTSISERRYGGKSATQRRAERRGKLLDAALELFGTQGYASTSIEAICARAGLNARYFYEEFDGREALLRAVYDRHVDAVFSAVAEVVDAAPASPQGRLEAGLGAFIEHTLADPRSARVKYVEMVGVSPALERRRLEVRGAYGELAAAQIAELLAPGYALPGGDLHVAAVALVSATDGIITDLLLRSEGAGAGLPDRAERERIVAALCELFVSALGV